VQKVGRYQVEGELGQGAMGVVYKATDPTIGRQVALKTLRLDIHGIEADEMHRRFQNEARAAGVLNHPNIITIYDAGEDGTLFYIAMEFIVGETLAAILKKRRVLPVEHVVGITRGVCNGLDFAHSKGIIHRDIKPANIMIAADGTAKIMDFGIAKAAGNLTTAGQVLGTPNYMSPEQVRGKPLDGRTDLFSLGVVIYEMLTGTKPFAAENVTSIIYKIVNEDPVAPHELNPRIDPGLSAIVMRALSKDANDRYQSGADLAREISNYSSYRAPSTSATGVQPSAAGQKISLAAAAPSAAVAPVTSNISTPVAALEPKPVPHKNRTRISIGVITALAIVVALAAIGNRVRNRIPAAQPQPVQVQPPAVTATETAVREKAPENVGEVTISSVPPGAKIEIDGKTSPEWVTPLRGEKLSLGKHTVRWTLPDHAPETKTVEIVGGKKTSVDAILKSLYATIHLASDPPGADIFMDGQPTGKKTPADLKVAPGSSSFLLRKQGYDDSGDTVTVAAGDTINITPKLSAAPLGKFGRFLRGEPAGNRGVLVIRTRPRGALVAVNGVVLPGATPVRIPIRPGRYTIQLASEGYQPVRREVVVESGKPTAVNEELVPQ
jgi:serine/threonine protein kinase